VSGPDPAGRDLGREAFGTACGLALVVGALAVVAPAFDALTATLVVLAVAGWASAHRRAEGGLGAIVRTPSAYAVAFGLLGLALGEFVAAPAGLGPWRALGLGAGLLPLWLVERGHRPFPGPRRRIR
jgi:hypothetical protein